MTTAYLLWIFLGWAGAHRFYCRRPRSGAFMLASALLWFFVGNIAYATLLITLAPVLAIIYLWAASIVVWMLVDLFLIPRWIREVVS
jgi:TM2 domain-containing membrane protein YozV